MVKCETVDISKLEWYRVVEIEMTPWGRKVHVSTVPIKSLEVARHWAISTKKSRPELRVIIEYAPPFLPKGVIDKFVEEY